MRVEVKDVVTTEHGEQLVLVSTAAGRATLPLRTPATEIVRNMPRTAELDVDVPIVHGENAQPTAERTYRIESDSEWVTLVGVVDGIDLDGLVYLRLGSDAIVMIEAQPDQFASGDWLRVVVPLNRTGISLI